MKNLETNKLIAEFMGVEKMYVDNFGDTVYYNPNDKSDRNSEMYAHQFEYDTSWSWLMPVYHKCMEVLGETKDKDAILDDKFPCSVFSSIENLYGAVLKFIEYYNKK